jgi:nicotinamide riboside transporter PnuC
MAKKATKRKSKSTTTSEEDITSDVVVSGENVKYVPVNLDKTDYTKIEQYVKIISYIYFISFSLLFIYSFFDIPAANCLLSLFWLFTWYQPYGYWRIRNHIFDNLKKEEQKFAKVASWTAVYFVGIIITTFIGSILWMCTLTPIWLVPAVFLATVAGLIPILIFSLVTR